MLVNAQKAENVAELRLIADQETRWSSTYYMLERFLSQKSAVRVVCLEIDKLNNYNLTRNEWDLLSQVNSNPMILNEITLLFTVQLVDLLKIFADSVKINEKENSCISEALPEIKYVFT